MTTDEQRPMDGLMRTAPIASTFHHFHMKFSKGRVLSMFKAMSPFRMRMSRSIMR